VKARIAAAARIGQLLSDYARLHCGRYILFGSAARGDLRHDSDIDILVDFPPDGERDAIRFAEDLCITEGQACDILPIRTRGQEFLERALKDAQVLA